MPKRAVRLSAAFCSTVKVAGKYSDGDGLMLIVTNTGSKRWGQRLVIRGKRRDLGLGSYPLVSLAQARVAASQNRQTARNGGDPLALREKDRTTPTFEAVMLMLLEKKAGELTNSKHIAQWGSTLRTYAVPRLGGKLVTEITVADTLEVLKPIWSTKSETASRLRGRIESVLAFATAHGWREGPNPATWGGNLDMLLPKPSKVKQVRHQPALAVEDIPNWMEQLRKRQGISARCLEFLTLTWARSGEARGAIWSEIDFEASIWNIPAHRTKTKEEHAVPLSNAALALLRGIPRTVGEEFVFPAPRGGELSDMALSGVMRRMHASEVLNDLSLPALGIREEEAGWRDPQSNRPAVPHGLRATARNWAGREEYPREMAELALGHRIGNRVEQAYHRETLVERRRLMMNAWAEYVTQETKNVPNVNGLRLV
ncbi:tyrosine-type recombinase/integrase [Lentibacter sp. XHP0401]|uniref:tyrosine-type recombinase/integrase n=1 Tax=Lentibacter sp. XHP0401 TaxID=2984334 RepID=UPI0021E74122|nr:integrase arm-type DNA-binding domain-containing protein [Lentibacter sp. XHP0401]MCV2892232.1 tyrosine-type recombinase/integrase [Lentibacter sp. XHP0401]